MEQKFRLGDKVWKIVNGKAEEVEVVAVAFYKRNDIQKVIYRVGDWIKEHSTNFLDDETSLFKTKEDLINSL